MTDQISPPPEEPGKTPQQPESDWKARYDGLVKKVEQLTLHNRALNEQLAAKTSELEQLRGDLVVKDTEKSAVSQERDRFAKEKTDQIGKLESEVRELRAFKAKVEAAKKIGHPELIEIMHTIPSVEDPAALETILSDFANFTDRRVKAREEQLLSGLTPGAGAPQAKSVSFSNSDEWARHVNSLPLGSPERQKVMDDWYAWMSKQ